MGKNELLEFSTYIVASPMRTGSTFLIYTFLKILLFHPKHRFEAFLMGWNHVTFMI